jgi:hypothetical protein
MISISLDTFFKTIQALLQELLHKMTATKLHV